jgi:hypothetical protein
LDWSFELLSLNLAFKDSDSPLPIEAFVALSQTIKLVKDNKILRIVLAYA